MGDRGAKWYGNIPAKNEVSDIVRKYFPHSHACRQIMME
jgi:hypothetical protein